jgi:DNA polymerase V
MSQRVMHVLSQYAPKVEVYSIDECFLDLTGMHKNVTTFCLDICAVVKQWTGIPVSIGISQTKTLAKLANRLAKQGHSKHGSVLEWSSIRDQDAVLETIVLSNHT